MDAAQMNQSQLAERLEGFDRFSVMKLVKNQLKNPKDELITQIAHIFHTTPDEIRFGVDSRAPKASAVGESPVNSDDPQNVLFNLLEELRSKGVEVDTVQSIQAEIMKILFRLTESDNRVIRLLEKQRTIERMLEDRLGIKLDD